MLNPRAYQETSESNAILFLPLMCFALFLLSYETVVFLQLASIFKLPNTFEFGKLLTASGRTRVLAGSFVANNEMKLHSSDSARLSGPQIRFGFSTSIFFLFLAFIFLYTKHFISRLTFLHNMFSFCSAWRELFHTITGDKTIFHLSAVYYESAGEMSFRRFV